MVIYNIIIINFDINAEAGGTNQFIEIDLDFTVSKTARCIFREKQSQASKYCRIDYGPKTTPMCNSLPHSNEGFANTSDTVTVHLSSANQQHFVYCYRVTASDSINTVAVVGIFTGNV